MRTPYRFTTQIYSDPSAPLVDGFWYFTDLPFLNFASAFGSRIYDDNKTNLGTLGEQYQPDFPYSTSQPILGLTGGHECGTPDEFLWGLPYPPLGPPVRYDQDSIPLCCQRLPTPQVTAGSLAGSLISHAHVRASAVTAGASVASLLSHSPRTGSAVTSGASVASLVSRAHVRASAVTAGASVASLLSHSPRTGSAVTSGASVASLVSRAHVRASAVTVGASVASLLSHSPRTGSAVTSAASVASLVSRAHVRASAVTAGASVASLLSHSPRTGSAVTSGASVTSEYSLSPVTPGPTCATSAAIVPDTGRAANGTPGVPQWWYGLHFGDAEHCAVFVSNSNLAELRIWLGSCAALSLFSVTTTGQNVHLPSLFEVWHFEILSPTTDVYSLQINSGACV